jgi:hypothetical protein
MAGPQGLSNLGKKEQAERHKLFLDLLPVTRTVGEAYIQAGFTAKSANVARAAACRLIRKLDAKLDYRQILESVGLTDRHLGTKIKDLVDDKDGHLSVKACNLATRCKGWQQPNVSIGVGVEIHITGVQAQAQAQDDAIDVTASALDDLPPEEEQVLD